jgi:hypothetical protein
MEFDMEVGNPSLNTFSFGNFLKISTDFELSKYSRKTDLNELLSDMLIEIFIANPSKLHFGQEVMHGDLQRLGYDLGDMHILTLKIKEDIKFHRGVNIKLNPGKFVVSLQTELISSICTIEINTF